MFSLAVLTQCLLLLIVIGVVSYKNKYPLVTQLLPQQANGCIPHPGLPLVCAGVHCGLSTL